MAFQVGTFKISGTVGPITFYKRNGKYLSRRRTSIDHYRIKTDPAFAQFRECSTVFAKASSLASFIYKNLKQKQRTFNLFGKLTGKINLLLREGKTVQYIIDLFFKIYKIKMDVPSTPEIKVLNHSNFPISNVEPLFATLPCKNNFIYPDFIVRSYGSYFKDPRARIKLKR